MEERKVYIELECPECGGDGKHEIGPECNRPASSCCGGCYRDEMCCYCSGEGKIDRILTEDDVQIIVDKIFEAHPCELSIRRTILELIELNN